MFFGIDCRMFVLSALLPVHFDCCTWFGNDQQIVGGNTHQELPASIQKVVKISTRHKEFATNIQKAPKINIKCLEGNRNCQQACRKDRKLFFHHSGCFRIFLNQKNFYCSEPVVNPAPCLKCIPTLPTPSPPHNRPCVCLEINIRNLECGRVMASSGGGPSPKFPGWKHAWFHSNPDCLRGRTGHCTHAV